MAQPQSSSGIIAGAITIFGLGLVWVTVATNFPSQEELSSAALPAEIRQAARPPSPLAAPPTLDLPFPPLLRYLMRKPCRGRTMIGRVTQVLKLRL